MEKTSHEAAGRSAGGANRCAASNIAAHRSDRRTTGSANRSARRGSPGHRRRAAATSPSRLGKSQTIVNILLGLCSASGLKLCIRIEHRTLS